EKIRVLVVDDHPVVREGIRSLLSSYSDIEVVGETENGFETLERVRELHPDVVLLDIKLPGADGIVIARRIRQEHPDVKVLILTVYDDERHLCEALKAGVHGYLLKSVSHKDLANSIREVYRGQRLLSPSLVSKVLEEFERLAQRQASNEVGLDEEELELLHLIAQGATTRELAQSFHWSEATVKRRVKAVLTKLGASNRAHAVAKAIKGGLI
ncbi:MAG: DNA-binding response regulator, partial [Chloroflexi bacterium]